MWDVVVQNVWSVDLDLGMGAIQIRCTHYAELIETQRITADSGPVIMDSNAILEAPLKDLQLS